jgi:hypothetical protein
MIHKREHNQAFENQGNLYLPDIATNSNKQTTSISDNNAGTDIYNVIRTNSALIILQEQ